MWEVPDDLEMLVSRLGLLLVEQQVVPNVELLLSVLLLMEFALQYLPFTSGQARVHLRSVRSHILAADFLFTQEHAVELIPCQKEYS
jgi:hypothetical protein